MAGWLVTDGLLRLSHLPLSPGITLLGLALGAWWWRRPRPLGPSATDVPGWLQRLERLNAQFGKLAGAEVDPVALLREYAAFIEALHPLTREAATRLAASGVDEVRVAGREQQARAIEAERAWRAGVSK